MQIWLKITTHPESLPKLVPLLRYHHGWPGIEIFGENTCSYISISTRFSIRGKKSFIFHNLDYRSRTVLPFGAIMFFSLFAGWPFLQQQQWQCFSSKQQDADRSSLSALAPLEVVLLYVHGPEGEWPKLWRAHKDSQFLVMNVCITSPITKATWWISALLQPWKCICRLLT